MENDEMVKDVLLGVLNKWKQDLVNGRCTLQQMRSLLNIVVENVDMDASLDEIADHFGQSKNNVSNVIARRYIGRPKRKVLYPLQKIIQIVPQSWLRRK